MRHLKTGGFSILTLALVVATSLVAAPTKGEAAPPTKEEIEHRALPLDASDGRR